MERLVSAAPPDPGYGCLRTETGPEVRPGWRTIRIPELDWKPLGRYLQQSRVDVPLEPCLTGESESEAIRCWIRIGGREIELEPGEAFVGRHDSCHVVLDDPQASRRHALLRFNGSQLSVQDLGSVNGVLVNDRRIESTEVLKHRDQIRLGNQIVVVHLSSSGEEVFGRQRVGAETIAGVVTPSVSGEESTVVREGEALETLTLVAEKVLAMGRGAEAERILKKAMLSLRKHAQAGGQSEPETLQTAAVFAVRLAEATDKGEWIDYVFELYSAVGQVLPRTVVDRLYSAVRSTGAVRLDLIRSYLSQLQERKAGFGPSDRFLLRRIEGLERLVVLR